MRRIHAVQRSQHRDDGTTLVEILISIVLLGIGVGAMLTMLSVTIQASATERDHANAHAWLQTATDVLYGLPREDCNDNATSTTDEQAVYDAYIPHVKNASNPENWPATKIEIVRPILFWNGSIYQPVCYDDDFWNLQLIRLQVRNPDGKVVESVEVVKG